MIAVYYDDHMKLINTLVWQNPELPIDQAGGTYSCNCVLKRYNRVPPTPSTPFPIHHP
jgi:hypothetical protein